MLTANINLSVPPIPDNDVCFANSDAWVNYWSAIDVNVNFNGAISNLYIESVYDGTLDYVGFNYLGTQYNVPSLAQFNSLLQAYQTLNVSYKQLRDAMKAAGFITNSQ